MAKRLLLAVACLGVALAGPSMAQTYYYIQPNAGGTNMYPGYMQQYQYVPPVYPQYTYPRYTYPQPQYYMPAPNGIEPNAGATMPMPWGYQYQQPQYRYQQPQYRYQPPQVQRWYWGR